jgi:hypothetical protein
LNGGHLSLALILRLYLTMDPHLMIILTGEARGQLDAVEIAWYDIRKSIRTGDENRAWYAIDAATGALTRVANIFWPSETAGAGIVARGAELVRELGIAGGPTENVRQVRNKLQHYEQYIERWYAQSRYRNFLDRWVGPDGAVSGFAPEEYGRRFDPGTGELKVFEYSCNLRGAVQEGLALRSVLPTHRQLMGRY